MKWLCLALATSFFFANAQASASPDLCGGVGPDFGPFFDDATVFNRALAATDNIPHNLKDVSGVIVPHHLEVPDLIAGGLRLAERRAPKRIVVLFPDHFKQSTSAISTTERDFQTVLGPVKTDQEGVNALLAYSDLVKSSCMFDIEHGLLAILPFVAQLYPEARIIPIAFDLRSGPEDWERVIEILKPLLGANSIVVQATDFSHYLPHFQARYRDQQVLNLISAQSLAHIAVLEQPVHVDSKGAFYVSAALQRDHFKAEPIVLANMNQQEKYSRFLEETTSYVVAAYAQNTGPSPDILFGHGQRIVIGGDLFVGRVLPLLLLDELVLDGVRKAVLTATGGAPLLVNLEGVLMPRVPSNLPHLTLGMPGDLVVRLAGMLNIRAFGLANNHSFDLGQLGLSETKAALELAGISFFEQGESVKLNGVQIAGLSDMTGSETVKLNLLTPDLLNNVVETDASIPVVALLHWGKEFSVNPGERERWLSDELRKRGVTVIVGSHPHAASETVQILGGGETIVFYSVGNFLFDQNIDFSSGALVEMRIFPQGTVFARQIPLPHLFDIMTKTSSK